MTTFEKKAAAVADAMSKADGLSALESDRPFLEFLTELLKELLPALIGCFGGAAGAAKQLRNPGVLTKVRLRMEIRRRLRDDQSVNMLAGPLFDAVLKVAHETTEAEVKEMAAQLA